MGGGQGAKADLANAAMVTEVRGREADSYAKWAQVPGASFHVLSRASADRKIKEGGGKLSLAPLNDGGTALVQLREQPDRAGRDANLRLRYGQVTLKRPHNTIEKDLPKALIVRLVEVVEIDPPAGV